MKLLIPGKLYKIKITGGLYIFQAYVDNPPRLDTGIYIGLCVRNTSNPNIYKCLINKHVYDVFDREIIGEL